MTLERAIATASEAHAGQKDKAGNPYILHPLRVMLAVTAPEERIVAALHDVVEDTPWTLDALRAEGFSNEVVAAVDAMTRRDGEDYFEFVRRAVAHPIARPVKIADLRDNMDMARIAASADGDHARIDRYREALRMLGLCVTLCLLPLGAFPRAQQRPAPIIDMHLHANAANSQGPPPLAVCTPFSYLPHDAKDEWPKAFLEITKKPPCSDPVWSPATDEGLMNETLAILRRRNIIGVLSGTADRVRRWRELAPAHIIPGLGFQLGPKAPSVDDLQRLRGAGALAVLAEVSNQYVGIAPDDPAFEPYLAMAEQADLPVGIHIGTGPPGAPYLGFERYRARLHSALLLEEPLLQHPKLRVYIMHAGWPMVDDLLAVLWAHPQVYLEVGAIDWALPRQEFHRYLQRIVEAGFGKRVMFGSDQMVWPGVIERAIQSIESAPFLSESQKRDILYNNAARFLRLSDADIAKHHGR